MLTIVNDGASCRLSQVRPSGCDVLSLCALFSLFAAPAFSAARVPPPTQAFHATGREGRIIAMPPGSSIGSKRNAGARAVEAEYIASFDDDDFCLPSRLSSQLVSSKHQL